MAAIKQFFEWESTRGKITSAELLEFKRSCSPDVWDGYVMAAKIENEKVLHLALS